jgi:hypothetical protein
VAALLVTVGCQSVPPDQLCDGGCADSGAGGGAGGPDAGCIEQTCAELNANCGIVQAGCETLLDCGSCASPQTCGGGGTDHRCGCTPFTTAQICADLQIGCGTVKADDGCGNLTSYDCGGCPGGQMCAAGACCAPPTDPVMCQTAGFACGQTLIIDACGQHRNVDCGNCGAGSCAMSDTGSSCGPCVNEDDATFCARHGATCGSLTSTDNCGAARTVSCGGCSAGVSCGGTGVANQCACLPLLSLCAGSAQCCNDNCGPAGLCCVAQGDACVDDADCCAGNCALGRCTPFMDGGIIGNGMADDGGVL